MPPTTETQQNSLKQTEHKQLLFWNKVKIISILLEPSNSKLPSQIIYKETSTGDYDQECPFSVAEVM